MQVAVILSPNIQRKLSSHGLILSNAYNETILFDSINTEENLFSIINRELGTDANVQNRNAKKNGLYVQFQFQHVANQGPEST